MKATLDKLDSTIAAQEDAAREAEAKAQERRAQLAGDEAPDVNTDEFKAMTDELDGYYRTMDEARDAVVRLKGQRVTLARTLGVPVKADEPGNPDEQLKSVSQDQLAALIAAAQGKGVMRDVPIGERVIGTDGYKALRDSGILDSSAAIGTVHLGKAMDREEFKALITGGSTSAGAFKEPQITAFLPLLQRPVQIVSRVQTVPVSTDSIKYVKEVLAGHNVAIVADPTTAEAIGSGDPVVTATAAGLKPESQYTYTTVSADVETLAHFLPVHRNQFADVPQLQGIIDAQLRYGLYEFLERQIVSGDGSTGNLRGILNTTGIVEQVIGADSLIVALHKVITAIRLGFIEPSLIVMHPTDWEAIRLMRAMVAMTNPGNPDADPDPIDPTVVETGDFLFGPPSQAGVQTLWGIPVMLTPVVPLGSPLVGEFAFAQLYLREGVSVNASDSHADFFRRNLIALLAEMRAGFGVRRPAAFGTVVES